MPVIYAGANEPRSEREALYRACDAVAGRPASQHRPHSSAAAINVDRMQRAVSGAHREGRALGYRLGYKAGARWGYLPGFAWGLLVGCGATALAMWLGVMSVRG